MQFHRRFQISRFQTSFARTVLRLSSDQFVQTSAALSNRDQYSTCARLSCQGFLKLVRQLLSAYFNRAFFAQVKFCSSGYPTALFYQSALPGEIGDDPELNWLTSHSTFYFSSAFLGAKPAVFQATRGNYTQEDQPVKGFFDLQYKVTVQT